MEQELIKRIETEAAARGLKESTLLRMAVNDGKLYRRLKTGGSLTLKTLGKITAYLDGNPTAHSTNSRPGGSTNKKSGRPKTPAGVIQC